MDKELSIYCFCNEKQTTRSCADCENPLKHWQIESGNDQERLAFNQKAWCSPLFILYQWQKNSTQRFNFHPYKMIMVHELSDHDKAIWAIFCKNFLNLFIIGMVLLMSDKVHFHLFGTETKQNFHYWSDSNHQQFHKHHLHSSHVTIWCAMASSGFIGPYFFKEWSQAVIVGSFQ